MSEAQEQKINQYNFRALKSIGITESHPHFKPLQSFQQSNVENIRAFKYSPDGSRYAIAATTDVRVYDAQNGKLLIQIDLPNVIEVSFSPKGTWISTWERYVKPTDESAQHKNMRVWDVSTGQEVISFSQKSIEAWSLQFTDNESHALRLISNEIQVYDPSKGFQTGSSMITKLKLEGLTSYKVSPGRNPSISIFIPEKNGSPACVKIFGLIGLTSNSLPISSKTFFKADKVQFKWNRSGTSLLFLTHTDVDKTGKSYYGETNLYLLSANGTFDCRVTLDRQGGIHDFVWSPNDKEFTVSYGYMPAKTTIFDHRSNLIHDFGTAPRNFIAYNPQGRLLLTAGFGNLAGTIDIWDRRTLKKVSTIEGSNTSHCEWSPDGRFILCATLSPRLRVDNGIRIFHYTGSLVHLESIENLYAASWRPASAELFPFRQNLSPAPPSIKPNGVGSTAAAVTPVKPAGAYRPPHARGTTTPSHFKREDEGGAPYVANPNSNGHHQGSRPRGLPPGAAPPNSNNVKNNRKNGVPGSGTIGLPESQSKTNQQPKKNEPNQLNTHHKKVESLEEINKTSTVSMMNEMSLEEKKKRSLMKKLTAIEQLKERKKKGEKLELTQLKKIENEEEIREALKSLG
ncbi:eukaryotic translation initiation factor eIF2A-domain-containing protein [Melampsora americana]|nr:eukaryotic translation initiation factor eIF2A-domain-containing protein [Melampsora americana]